MAVNTKDTVKRKKEHARLLYTQQGVTNQKELAERTGVSKTTINKWVNEENWEYLRGNVIITKDQELKRLYLQITELNDFINKKEEGQRFANSKEADTLVKLTAAVKQLEMDTSLADAIQVLKDFINFVRIEDFEAAKLVTTQADAFINSLIK
ncbi:YfeC-like transcriptional regulator [Croceivirga sp. JEA036]|uniref:YfeC-like transcriptional regulator n=1 Tax=Croceivirga sp. JEA036 TaxID=2721162 RepID=UPI001438BFA2|nr:YfeC-like transcriptional regulator [Croceivirga sp. JEA036]NJB36383.1 helix-turn-helix domain-containing protein [Croceivirga sp. JEA036]